MKKIVIVINNCNECQYCRIQRVPVEDRFQMVTDWLCCNALKLITIKKEYEDCPPIPDWCPLETIVEGDPDILVKEFNLPKDAENALKFFTEKNWEINAAIKIDKLLSEAVIKNTGIKIGFFSGVSIQDIANIIDENQPRIGGGKDDK